MNGDTQASVVTSPPPTTASHKERYFNRGDENNPEYLRERNMTPDLRQDLNMMEHKRVSVILQSPVLVLVMPVNDIRGSDSIACDKGEKTLRCKRVAFYRLADLFGWSQLIYNHITTKVNLEQEHILIGPFGLLYSEVTPWSLIKINLQGDIVDRGSTNLGVNEAGFPLHSAHLSSHPEVKCIVHIHTPAGGVVSALKCGLLPISPETFSLGEVAYHDYHGILLDEEEKVLVQKNLGPNSKVLILWNHGLVSVGESAEEAFYYIRNLVVACDIQVQTLASAGGPENLVLLDPEKYRAKSRPLSSPEGDDAGSSPRWLTGEQEFEALMRMLDNLGYPALREKSKKHSDAKNPAGVTGGSFTSDGDLGTCSPLSFQKQQREKTRWLSSGQGDEASEGGQSGSTPNARACCPLHGLLHWTKEDGHRTSTSAVPNLFLPLNTNPKEVQEMRNKIQNLQDIKRAGPQSQASAEHTTALEAEEAAAPATPATEEGPGGTWAVMGLQPAPPVPATLTPGLGQAVVTASPSL
ncbi:LOW QUALITY PROTEIN: alpha-adducin-like [Thomomys bottae]